MMAHASSGAAGTASSTGRGSCGRRSTSRPTTAASPLAMMMADRLGFWPNADTRSPPVHTAREVAARPVTCTRARAVQARISAHSMPRSVRSSPSRLTVIQNSSTSWNVISRNLSASLRCSVVNTAWTARTANHARKATSAGGTRR